MADHALLGALPAKIVHLGDARLLACGYAASVRWRERPRTWTVELPKRGVEPVSETLANTEARAVAAVTAYKSRLTCSAMDVHPDVFSSLP